MKPEDVFKPHPPSERFMTEFMREHQKLAGKARSSRPPSDEETKVAVVETLGRLLGQKEVAAFLRLEAVGLLGELGAGAASAVPALVQALEDDYSFLRVGACQALGRLGPAAQPAFPALKQCAADKDPNVQRAAVKALERISREEMALHGSDTGYP